MCGICGIVSLAGPAHDMAIAQRTLDAMTDSMKHRGPDGRGTWTSPDERTLFGHRRLAIVDLSPLGAQPMTNEDGSIWITFNGEIYNHCALRAALEAQGHRFRSNSDTEVLVHLYEAMGDKMVEYLDGDFGFGLWDDRRKHLLLARDRAGVKPVYYTEVDGQFLFASEIRALLQHPGVVAEIDEEALYYYLTYLVVPAPKTLVRGIYKLPIAGALTLELSGDEPCRNTWQFWQPYPGQMALRHSDLDAQFEELFERSVEKRLMSDVPVGILFSGGVDSTLNAISFQKRIDPQRVQTFNVGMVGGGPNIDESATAREMARRFGTQHHEILITQDDLLNTAQSLADYQDEPISDPVCVPLYFVTKLAREAGMVVMHAGEGADEIFCGYDNYRRFLRHNDQFWNPLSRMPSSVSRMGFSILRHSPAPRHRKMADALLRIARGQEFFMSSAVAYYEDEKASVLSRDFKHRSLSYDAYHAVAPLYRRIEEHLPDATFLQKMTFIELQLRLPELLLMRADKMSMANSIEVRVPFLDRDLVDFALSVPESFKLRDGISKEPVKRLAARYAGHEAIYKPKRGFGVPIQTWFRERLGESFREMIVDNRADVDAFFDKPTLLRTLDRGPQTTNQAFQLWVIYNFLNWKENLTKAATVA